MKKIIYIALSLFLLCGCEDLSNTPTKKTEEFLKKYQSLDNSVLTDLDNVLYENDSLNESQKLMYKDIMKKHYQNLSYEIKNETIDGDEAVVTVEISVTDFKKVLEEANSYRDNNMEVFYDENGEYSLFKFNDYKLNQLKEAKDKVKYTIEINLNKVDDVWEIGQLDQMTYDKINGIYNY